MNKPDYSDIPLGVPGASEGPALPADIADEIQKAFTYQRYVAAELMIAAIAGKNYYEAIWCEHHEDLLAEVSGGGYEAIQVKTISSVNATWTLSDASLLKSIKRFAELHEKHGDEILGFVFYSNAPPYIPAASTKRAQSLAASPLRLAEHCEQCATCLDLARADKEALEAVAAKTGCDVDAVFRVFAKLEFKQGAPLTMFRQALAFAIPEVPGCETIPVPQAYAIRDELLLMFESASTQGISSLDWFSSVISSNGRPEAVLRNKRVSADACRTVIKQAQNSVFRYADVGGCLQLGSAKGQKDVLRQKMTAGYVGNFFDSIWMQALASEQRLIEMTYTKPDAVPALLEQLYAVVLVECQNAEAMAALEGDARLRGLKIYQQILERTEALAAFEKEKVGYEPKETLRGVAGMLSGDCKFAWGVSLGEGA